MNIKNSSYENHVTYIKFNHFYSNFRLLFYTLEKMIEKIVKLTSLNFKVSTKEKFWSIEFSKATIVPLLLLEKVKVKEKVKKIKN